MKKHSESSQGSGRPVSQSIPDIHIIDLEAEDIDAPGAAGQPSQNQEDLLSGEDQEDLSWEDTEEPEEPDSSEENDEDEKNRKKIPFIATHVALLIVVAAVLVVLIVRLTNLSDFISQEEIFSDGEGTYDNTFDMYLPVLDSQGNLLATETGKDLTILMLGNSPLTDSKDSPDGLANIVAERTGANVINCGISGSYMACVRLHYRADLQPLDAYTPYWLTVLTVTDATDYYYADAMENLGADTPPEAEYVYETLSNIDMNTVDVVVYMYDGTDYLLGHGMYSDDNPTDIQTFTGNMEASIELLQNNFPHIRIIVMSPAYAFGVDDNGEYISSDIKIYGNQHFLSTYSVMQYKSCVDRGVTYVDNLYGTINEDDAPQYLTDNIHLNAAGRERMAERLIYALTYFND